ncbi:MAG: ABC transporter ATP-binding protein [Gemmatimonadota bacterium]
MTTPATPAVEFRGLSKFYDGVPAVDDVSLTLQPGEFFSLLGPSGCGKTTTLRMLAGFDLPDEGEVLIEGRAVTGVPPYRRNLSMVFQSYALFPHLSVERNVAFGLEQRRTPKPEIPDRVREALRLVRLDPVVYGRRMPSQLSGGQRQRVALARALVLEPSILLLDEPLGAIDLKLRKEMQLELKALNRRLGITFLYVTHDQEEALTMSDRIAVMDHGKVVQVGTPAEIYENPRTAFVAGFIGESNFVDGTILARTPEGWTVRRKDTVFRIPDIPGLAAGGQVNLAIRPEWLDLFRPGEAPADENTLAGTIRDVIYLGETIHVAVDLREGGLMRVAFRNEGQLIKPVPWRQGDAALVGWLPEDCQVLEQA